MISEYRFIACPFISIVVCQIIKFFVEFLKTKKPNIGRLFNGAGGMPSAHATFASSLTVLIGYECGFSSPIFGVSLIFMCIVSYDALGVRWESGEQAIAINQIFDLLKKGKFKHLKEQIGHKPLEVFVGLLLGTIMASIFTLYI